MSRGRGAATMRERTRLPAPKGGPEREEQAGSAVLSLAQVREIMELRRALARTRQDLQRSRGRGASSSDEVHTCIMPNYSFRFDITFSNENLDQEPCRREELSGSLSGSLTALSNKPCLNRELVAKLRSMTETIKMLSTENVALREENDGLALLQVKTSGERQVHPQAMVSGKVRHGRSLGDLGAPGWRWNNGDIRGALSAAGCIAF